MALTALSAPRPSAPATTATATRRTLAEIGPVLLSLLPLGWALGVATVATPLAPAAGWAAGPLLVSGAAHFALLSAYAGGAGALAAGATALAISARGLLFSAALSARLGHEPLWFRALAPYVLVDQMFVPTDAWLRRGERGRALRRAYLVAGGALWLTWVGAITAGMCLGPVVPTAWRVELVLGALLAAMLVRSLTGRSARVSAAVAAVAAVAAAALPAGLGVLAATAAGAAAAALSEARRP